jgi:hypothetical protein
MNRLSPRAFVIIALCCATALLGGCDLFSTRVRYEADCDSGSMNVTITDEDGEIAFFPDRDTSWQYVFELDNDAEDVLLYIAAENNNGTGTVSVRIYLDGSLKESGSNSTAYGTAAATMTFN